MIRKIGVISPVMSKANVNPFSNLINILISIHGSLSPIITVNEGVKFVSDIPESLKIVYKSKNNIFLRLFYHLWFQLKITYSLLMNKDVDLWIFYLGEVFILPNIAAKVIGKKTILIMGSRAEKDIEHQNGCTMNLVILIKNLNLRLFSKIILYSSSLINSWGLQKHRDKVLIAGEHYIDLNRFKVMTKLGERSNRIGYIGRLSEEKGVMNFLESISLLNITTNQLNILLGGDGRLTTTIGEFIRSKRLDHIIEMSGWIDHHDLPKYLNTLKLLVLPSYTEGLPNIMLEAMACGTPILATPVGAIPDLIIDGCTGFIMENNSPDIIAKNIKKALGHPNLGSISVNSRLLIEQEFSYQNVARRWKEIIDTLDQNGVQT